MGDRGPMGMVVVTAIAALTIVLGTVRWLDTRGLRVTEASCRWDPERSRYVAALTVENRDELYKAVQTTVQGRFRPPEGRDWPHRKLRNRYEAVTQPVELVVGPRTSASAGTLFELPGVEGFLCEARAKIVGQERFTEPPDQALLEAVNTPGQAPRGGLPRRRMRP